MHTSVVWDSRAARATPPRPRPLSLSRSHGCCSNRAPLVPTDRPASGDGEHTLPQEPARCLGPGCAPCRPLLRAQGGGACPTPPQRCRLSCVEAGPAAWSCGPTHAY